MRTPVEFHVDQWLFDESESEFLLSGRVALDQIPEPGMVVSIALNREFVMTEPVHSVRVLARHPHDARIVVAVRSELGDDVIWKSLDVREEMVLLWNQGETVDVARHFVYGEKTVEITIPLKDLD